MGRYIIKIWENEHERELGNSTVIERNLNSIDNAIPKAKNIMKEYKYASLEIRNSFNEQTLYYCTPTEEKYFEDYIENAKTQEKVNVYATAVYGNNLYNQNEEIYGKVNDVISVLRENQEHINNPKNEVAEEMQEFINEETDELVDNLKQYHDSQDFVYLRIHPMSGFFVKNDISNLLEDLQKDYMLKITDRELKDMPIKSVVATYYEMNGIYNLSEYRDDENMEVTPSFSSFYKDIFNHLRMKITEITTNEDRPGKYLTSIKFENGTLATLTSKGRYTIEDITQNIEYARDLYVQSLSRDLEDDMEME